MIRLLCLFLLIAGTTRAAEIVFPGLHSLLSDTEWRRSGLDQLSPDQVGVIDAALIRYVLAQSRAPVPPAPGTMRPANPAVALREPSLLERFGLPSFRDDWRSVTPLESTVVRWRGGNRFVLANGQVWEGAQTIPIELVGKNVQIAARPRGQYALIVEDGPAPFRVIRLE